MRRPHPAQATAAPHTHYITTKRAAQRAPMHARYGSAPQGAVHLSYFLINQLYPGIRDRRGEEVSHLCLFVGKVSGCLPEVGEHLAQKKWASVPLCAGKGWGGFQSGGQAPCPKGWASAPPSAGKKLSIFRSKILSITGK